MGGSRSPGAATHSGCVDARNVGVSSGETGGARNVGVSPGETQDARYVGVSPAKRIVAQKTGIPRARRIVNEYMLDYYYCIRPVLVPILRRHSPYVKHCMCD